ncbi:hypothetical protein [Nocardioides sp.]|uniref:hypothetical protein n=1 Tax=Nocardioides sp. TaxID=35761 RepID=UPI0037833D2C
MATQRTILTGLVQTPVAAAADATGDYCVPTDSRQRLAIRVKNGGGSAITVTLDDVNSVGPDQAQSFNADVQVSVPAGAERVLAITDTTRFLSLTTGRVSWTYSAVTSVTVDVFGV